MTRDLYRHSPCHTCQGIGTPGHKNSVLFMNDQFLHAAALLGCWAAIIITVCITSSSSVAAAASISHAAATSAAMSFNHCVSNNINLAHITHFPGTSSFEELSDAFWNTARTLTREPAAVAQPTSAEQVSQLVVCANAANLRFTAKGGGHSYEAMSLINNGLVIDLAKMDHMRLVNTSEDSTQVHYRRNMGNSSITPPRLVVGAGARVGPIYAFLFKRGLMLEGATCPTVGVSGLALGGGTGHSTRKLGLLADRIVSAEVVTTAGAIFNVSAGNHSDLFWALRGGGANYAIVTQWEFQTARYPKEVSYGSVEWAPTAEHLTNLLQAFNDWKPWLLPEDVARMHVAMYWDKVMLELYCWCSEDQVKSLLGTFPAQKAGLPGAARTFTASWNFSEYMLSTSVTNCYGAEKWGWENITTTAAVQQAEDVWRKENTKGVWPFKGGSAVFVDTIPKSLLANCSAVAMQRIANPQSFTLAVVIAAGGRQRTESNDYTGFGYRGMTQQLEVGTEAHTAADALWIDTVLATLMPASQGRRFYNHLECLDESARPWESYFGDNARQLQRVKARYDPDGKINGMNCEALDE